MRSRSFAILVSLFAFCLLPFNFRLAVLAQGRIDRPSFFQDGQRLMEQEIQKLQQQQSTAAPEHPSQLLTIQADNLQWQKFLFTDGGFSVWMPQGMQSEETVVLPTSIGALKFKVFATHPQLKTQPLGLRFIAAYADVPTPTQTQDSATILEAVRQGIIAKTEFQLVNQQPLSEGSYPGEQFSLQKAGEAIAPRAVPEAIAFRVYLINQRLYVLAADQKNATGLSQEVVGFFDSFRLLQ